MIIYTETNLGLYSSFFNNFFFFFSFFDWSPSGRRYYLINFVRPTRPTLLLYFVLVTGVLWGLADVEIFKEWWDRP